PVERRSLDFLCPAPLHACAGLRPSRRLAVPETRSPSRSSTGCCPPSAAPRPETQPDPEHLGPRAALPPRLPALCLANSYCYSSIVEAGLLPMDKSKRRGSPPEADRGRVR